MLVSIHFQTGGLLCSDTSIFNFLAGDTHRSKNLNTMLLCAVAIFYVFQIFYFYLRRNRKGIRGRDTFHPTPLPRCRVKCGRLRRPPGYRCRGTHPSLTLRALTDTSVRPKWRCRAISDAQGLPEKVASWKYGLVFRHIQAVSLKMCLSVEKCLCRVN